MAERSPCSLQRNCPREKPRRCSRAQPLLAAAGKQPLCSNRDPAQPKTNNFFFNVNGKNVYDDYFVNGKE